MDDLISRTPLTERTIAHALERHARAQPAKLALRDHDVLLNYAQLHEKSWGLSAVLDELGIGPQETVVTMFDNHVDAMRVALGLSVGRKIEVPVNPAFKGRMLAYVIADSRARLAVVEDEFCERLAAIADEIPLLETVVVRGGPGDALPARFTRVPFESLLARSAEPGEKPAPWDTQAIMYTSGTTGVSKGVVTPHGESYCAAVVYPDTTPDDVVMVSQPVFHIGGRWHGVYSALVAGGTAVVPPHFSATGFWDDVRKFEATSALIVGAMMSFLLQQPASDGDRRHTLKKISTAPVLPEFAERFGVDIMTCFGMTETGAVLINMPGDGLDPKSCGRPRPDVEARVVDDNDVELPDGEIGELLLRPRDPWTFNNGYHGLDAATRSAWRNLWWHTGDFMYRDASGQFFFVDRKKDAMRRRGENVSSFEVEAHLLARPEVSEAAAVAVPSEHSEDDILVALVLHDGAQLDLEQLLADLVEEMPYFTVPRYFRIVDELPKTPTFRVKKHDLRAAGVTDSTWDCERAGLRVTRKGIVRLEPAVGGAQVIGGGS